MQVARPLILVLAAIAVASASPAQIPSRSRTAPASNSPRLLVGNPHAFAAHDSAVSVAVGDGLRVRLDKMTDGQFRVLTRTEMNEALKQFGYPIDAILAPLPQRSLAQALNARVMVYATLASGQGGEHTVSARLAGLTDEAGNVVTMTQAAGQSNAEFGAKVAEGFGPALKVWGEARGCVDQIRVSAEKAAQSAKKAVAIVPTHGLANYCLGQLAIDKHTTADSAAAMKFFEAATRGDPLSLAAWTQLAAGYEAAGDTARTTDALKQMLLIAPTNQPLRELAFKKFLAYGKPEIAEQVANDGLQIDPSNLDLIELRANARIFRENYSGALDDLEQIVSLDSTRADTTFFVKYMVTASQKPDTARLVTYAARGVHRFPTNQTILAQAAGAYAMVGLADSLLPMLDRIFTTDTARAVGLALQEAKTQQDAKRYTLAAPFIQFAAKHGDASARENAAGLLLVNTLPMIQPPQNWTAAADGFRQVVSIANPAGRYGPMANYFLGLAGVNLIIAVDKEAEAQKSCDIARQVETLTSEGEAAMTKAAAYIQSPSGQGQARTYEQLKGYISGLKPRTASMIKVYCK